MYHSDTEILFPMRVAPNLRDLRGGKWRKLVSKVMKEKDASTNQLAFSLLLIRLNGCLTCHTGSYRAIRGCTICASQMIKRFKGNDDDLLYSFEQAKGDVCRFTKVDEKSQPLEELITLAV
ncbi:MAG: hypothetical protein IIC78_00930 [Chloroflexi bacterium]|nr:hypothetical protein [Chloroflexota bacterium]